MTGDRKDGKQTAERDGKARKPLSRDGNAKEASDARAETVRRIMKRNRDSGETEPTGKSAHRSPLPRRSGK